MCQQRKSPWQLRVFEPLGQQVLVRELVQQRVQVQQQVQRSRHHSQEQP